MDNDNSNMKRKLIDWPRGLQQWLRLIVAISGIIFSIIFMDDINSLATGATIIGFIGYLFDSLFTNLKEREKMNKENVNEIEKENKQKIIRYLDIRYVKIVIGLFILTAIFISILWEIQGGKYENYYLALGSLLGGLISGIGTLIAVIITTEETRKIQKENKKLHQEDIKRQRLADSLTCIPILDIDYSIKPIKINKRDYNTMCIYKELCTNTGTIMFWLNLKNIGNGPCKITGYKFNYQYKNNDQWKYNKQEYDNMVSSIEIVPQDRNHIFQVIDINEQLNNKTEVSYLYNLEIYFTDMINNNYMQIFFINESESHEIGIHYDLPELVENN